MATTQTYAGTEFVGVLAEEVLAPYIATGKTIERGLARTLFNIQTRQQIPKMDVDITFQDLITASGAFNPTGAYTRNLIDLNPTPIKVEMEYNATQVLNQWESAKTPSNWQGIQWASPYEQKATELTGQKISQALEQLWWRGKDSSASKFTFTGAFPGVIGSALASSDTNKAIASNSSLVATAITTAGVVTVGSTANLRNGDVVTLKAITASGVTIDGLAAVGQEFSVRILSSTTFRIVNYNTGAAVVLSAAATAATFGFINETNVANALTDALSLLPSVIAGNFNDLRIVVAPHVMRAYKKSQAIATALQSGSTNLRQRPEFADPYMDDVLNYTLVSIDNMHPNAIIAYLPENAIWGSNLGSGDPALVSRYMFPITMDQTVRVNASFSIAFAMGFYNETALITV